MLHFAVLAAGHRWPWNWPSTILGMTVLLLHCLCPPISAQTIGGVYIDSRGILRHTDSLAPEQQLELLRSEAIQMPEFQEVATASRLRKISLKRLEDVVHQHHRSDEPLPPEVCYLAGLQDIRYVFFYPEENDVVLAGPAEGWKQLPTGEVVGIQSGQPVLHLDDLIVALRYAFGEQETFIGCSIEPSAAGIQGFTTYMRRLGRRIDRSRIKQILSGMEAAMGLQQVKLYGVPDSSRFAFTMLAADYRLKRIALGHDPSPIRQVTNYLDLKTRRVSSLLGPQRQHRWWFIGQYETIRHSPDEMTFELQGQNLTVATAPTTIGAAESPVKAAGTDVFAERFATSFSRHFPKIAAKLPIFAELQNLVCLSVVAELIAEKTQVPVEQPAAFQMEIPEMQYWQPGHLLNETACPRLSHPAPDHVPSLANFRLVKGRHWLFTVSGGIEIDPAASLSPQHRQPVNDRTLLETRKANQPSAEVKGWWWD